ncbi:MAG: sensor histidine kinase [Polaribacter sp.]|uniref:sensor histidine kinase n=1 Tax=Polaribacter sp. TaxID=1920175 RepID=UPI003263A995
MFINKKHLLLITFFLSITVFGQNIKSINASINNKVFNSKNGYEVYSVNSMIFDDLGWLWVSGSTLELLEGKIDERTSIIQRYDGNRFYTVPFPDLLDGPPNFIKLFKRQDGQFYIIFIWQNKQKLFLLNPETLLFKEVVLPFSKEYQDISLFSYKEYFLAYLSKNNETNLFQLNSNLKFSLYPSKQIIPENGKGFPEFNHFIGLEDHFIASELRSGVFMYTKEGSLIKKVTLSDLGLKKKQLNFSLNIDFWFKREGVVYVYFVGIEGCYQYSKRKREWKKTNFLENQLTNKFNNRWFFLDAKENLIIQELDKGGSQFMFDFKNNLYRAPIKNNFSNDSKKASRDLSKELFLVNKGVFYHYHFNNDNVSTFLEKNSIRSMLQLNIDEVLITTEYGGWYIINLKTKALNKYEITFNDHPFFALEGRGIFEDESYYWSNDNKGIIWVDKKTKETKSVIYYPVTTMVEDDKYIYYGTSFYNLMKFDKKNKKNTILTSTSKYYIQSILKVDNIIYLACEEGLVLYENETTTLYNPKEKIIHSIFISIAKHPEYGILLGSQSGELFQFNSVTKEFTLLYKDKLKASIATILLDDKEGIWMNTYNGIISFDTKTKVAKRYTMNDGLSFYEANRHSALKTDDGHFLVGTLNGVNYFHPDEISKKIIDAELRLTATTYFDKTIKKVVEETSPQKLSSLKSISLPPESKNLQLQFNLFGIYDSNKVKYRYRLNKGLWVDLAIETEVRLSNLSSGEYTLEIEANNSINEIIGKPIVLSISVDEFFYKSDWFYFLLFIGSSGIILWYFMEERKKHQLKEQFSSQIISSQEEERSRVAKELHDSIGQSLLVLKNTVSKKENKNTTELKMIDNVINEVRNMSHNLHPFQFEQLGLVKSLENMMDAFQKSSDIFYSYEIDDVDKFISKEKSLFIFRMLQECIVNVEKHANATACNLTITNETKIIRFVLKDNGTGFIVDKAMNSLISLGLKSLQERAQYINAILRIRSKPKIGTTIIIKVKK